MNLDQQFNNQFGDFLFAHDIKLICNEHNEQIENGCFFLDCFYQKQVMCKNCIQEQQQQQKKHDIKHLQPIYKFIYCFAKQIEQISSINNQNYQKIVEDCETINSDTASYYKLLLQLNIEEGYMKKIKKVEEHIVNQKLNIANEAAQLISQFTDIVQNIKQEQLMQLDQYFNQYKENLFEINRILQYFDVARKLKYYSNPNNLSAKFQITPPSQFNKKLLSIKQMLQRAKEVEQIDITELKKQFKNTISLLNQMENNLPYYLSNENAAQELQVELDKFCQKHFKNQMKIKLFNLAEMQSGFTQFKDSFLKLFEFGKQSKPQYEYNFRKKKSNYNSTTKDEVAQQQTQIQEALQDNFNLLNQVNEKNQPQQTPNLLLNTIQQMYAKTNTNIKSSNLLDFEKSEYEAYQHQDSEANSQHLSRKFSTHSSPGPLINESELLPSNANKQDLELFAMEEKLNQTSKNQSKSRIGENKIFDICLNNQLDSQQQQNQNFVVPQFQSDKQEQIINACFPLCNQVDFIQNNTQQQYSVNKNNTIKQIQPSFSINIQQQFQLQNNYTQQQNQQQISLKLNDINISSDSKIMQIYFFITFYFVFRVVHNKNYNLQGTKIRRKQTIHLDFSVSCITWIANNIFALCGQENIIYLLDSEKQLVISQQQCHFDKIIVLYKINSNHKNQTLLISSSYDKQVAIQQVIFHSPDKASLKFQMYLNSQLSFVHSILDLQDNQSFITGDQEGEIIVWDYIAYKIITANRGQHGSKIVQMELIQELNKIIIVSQDCIISIWQLYYSKQNQIEKCVLEKKLNSSINSKVGIFSFKLFYNLSQNNNFIYGIAGCGDGLIRIVDIYQNFQQSQNSSCQVIQEIEIYGRQTKIIELGLIYQWSQTQQDPYFLLLCQGIEEKGFWCQFVNLSLHACSKLKQIDRCESKITQLIGKSKFVFNNYKQFIVIDELIKELQVFEIDFN